MKSVVIVGPAYPYRGGIAAFDEMLALTFAEKGFNVSVKTFTLQYPGFLFPGKTQFSDSEPPQAIDIERWVSSVNPFNWIKVGNRIRKMKPDLVVMKYWTPFIGPSLGTIARRIRKNRHTKVVVSVDNITPHEHHFTDRMLNSYFLNSVDGFVYMSGDVKKDLDSFRTGKPDAMSPHPIYSGYGEAVTKEEACRHLELDPDLSYSLFFGIIRDYKGLDILLEAWKIMKERGTAGMRRLLVAGEFYGGWEKYIELIAAYGLKNDVMLHDRFIPDDEVKYYFSASDVVIQPYKTATQSGVTQIAYNFGTPMIVTGVGGLPEIVPDDVVGYVTEVDPVSVADAIDRIYVPGNLERFRANIGSEKKRFSWDATAEAILRVAGIEE